MAEQHKKSMPRRLLRRALLGLLSLLAMALAFVAAVLLQPVAEIRADSYIVVEDPVPLTRMDTGAATDARALAQMFGAPLPMLPGVPVTGQGGNETHDGAIARVAALQYDGLTVTAVQPVSAAPLLLRDELSVTLRADVTVLGLPAVLAQGEGSLCVYFTSDFASYCVYAPQAEEADFYLILDRLGWAM